MKTPVAGIQDREPGQRASSQGTATIQPLDTKGAAAAFSEMLTEVDPRTGQPIADVDTVPIAEPAAPASAPPANAPSAESAPTPAAQLPPEHTLEGRLSRGIVTGSDVEALKDRLAPDEYRELRGLAEVQDTQRERAAAALQREHERLRSRLPEVADPEARQRLTDELTAYVSQFDYQPGELLSVTDSRALELAAHGLRASQRARELEQEIARLRAGVAPREPAEPASDREAPARPRITTAGQAARVQAAAERARRSGLMRDAAAVIRELGLAD
jgi:hypothetical protein